MPKFRSLRPAVVEAFQYDGTRESARDISRWTGGRARLRGAVIKGEVVTSFMLTTPAGEMEARFADWIVRLSPGEHAAYSHEAFFSLYVAEVDGACEPAPAPVKSP